MSSLKEIRGRIMSVKETLKITSAMLMISSAKLQGAQNALNSFTPYMDELQRMYDKLPFASESPASVLGPQRVAVVLVSSNQSLCGSFNNNVIRDFENAGLPVDSTDVFAVGKFGMRAAVKRGYQVKDFCNLADKLTYNDALSLSGCLMNGYADGLWKEVLIIRQHFVSKASQTVVRERFLPIPSHQAAADSSEEKYIFEPSPAEFMAQLLPEITRAWFYHKLLDAKTAEHAARTLAMQIASDNADNLLSELSLVYNKQRQQQITNEILDIVGGKI